MTSKFIEQNGHRIYNTTITGIVKELCAASEVDKLTIRYAFKYLSTYGDAIYIRPRFLL